MPHLKMPRKSTDTDMTPFVDIAFLLLSFFIMATKFKPEETVKVETPSSVSSDLLKETNAVLITISPDSKVYLNVSAATDPGKLTTVIQDLNSSRNLGLSDAEMAKFATTPIIGVPFSNLKSLLNTPTEQQGKLTVPGIPVTDSATNELVWWIASAKKVFAGEKLQYLIKGDNNSKFPSFDGVISALKRNEEFKYFLITGQEGAPIGSELDVIRKATRN